MPGDNHGLQIIFLFLFNWKNGDGPFVSVPLLIREIEGRKQKDRPHISESIEEAREWVAEFVKWYRYDHHHSGIKFLTPAERHNGKSQEILNKRHYIYEAAKARHPERWNGRTTRNWENITEVYLNPDRKYEETPVLSGNSLEAAAS